MLMSSNEKTQIPLNIECLMDDKDVTSSMIAVRMLSLTHLHPSIDDSVLLRFLIFLCLSTKPLVLLTCEKTLLTHHVKQLSHTHTHTLTFLLSSLAFCLG